MPRTKATHAWSKADAWLDGPGVVALSSDAQSARPAAPTDFDVVRAAQRWIEQHGHTAMAKAREKIEAMRRDGDYAGADTWLRIIVAIGELATAR